MAKSLKKTLGNVFLSGLNILCEQPAIMGYSYGYCVHRCTGFLDIQHRLGDASATSLCNDASSPLLQRIAAHLKWGSLHPGAFSKLISAV